ncbi:restriction enzyme, methylase subunit [Mixta calida B021323]|uniref:BREX-1 system adenine-specific DNA-methyltransferase PglX n=1 Tax=Mixta calida TaxID=665913 RepID=UPI0013317C57|nr:BREX-1 system adenine-specific DNA-methyltransferase PglX [Mixta calida]EII4816987.1 BREX-1 system adenine-specific DNA-methyltransferase PglX [Salmonella enterica]KAF0857757.1 restriction enzyme, methylase subunit [Mixta calida B021323]
MNTNNIKKYAPKARNQFRDAVIDKLTTLGITIDKKGHLQVADAEIIGETVRYGQFDYHKSSLPRREKLAKCAREQGFDVLVERSAYTWFNRLCAIRYMERHGYLDHGFQVLSHPDNPTGFEVLDHVPEVAESLGLDKARLVEMKLSGNQDEDLYRELLLGQCRALHRAMPFLFEAVDDEAELLLPDNLTRTDSILRNLVDDIPPEDWDQVEVIGWLYQFYISEKKDAVIGKVVKSEDIPAATQLFTPNWIVQYLVQNSVGRQWLQTYPDSQLKGKMDYYIEPAEQTPEVQAQLAAITPSSIEPENIKVLDPACGSGHILIEAYNVLKNIYEERGYRGRDIPQLILENNIFGLDIDDRAAQLSGFALMMMARKDDRRIIKNGVRLNIVSLQESLHLDIAKLWQQLNFHQQSQTGSIGDMFAENTELAHTDSPEYQLLMRTLKLFVNAKTLGSLIQVPHEEEAALKIFLDALFRLEQEGDIQQRAAAKAFIPYIQQAWILAQRYDVVVANPPYMGSKGMNGELKGFAQNNFPNSKSDLFAIFIERGFLWLKEAGFNSMVTMQSWMFLSSYENMRASILNKLTIETMVHMGNGVMKIAFGTNATVFRNIHIPSYEGAFSYVENDDINEKGYPKPFPVKNERFKTVAADDFKKIPGQPIAYWVSDIYREVFIQSPALSSIAKPRQGLATSDNNRFLKLWYEPSLRKINFSAQDRAEALKSKAKWFPCQKGGSYRKWFGNHEYLVNWENDGRELLDFAASLYGSPTRTIKNIPFYFREGATWSTISSSDFSIRYSPSGFISETKGAICFADDKNILLSILGFGNSKLVNYFLKSLSPTLDYHEGPIGKLPFKGKLESQVLENVVDLIDISEEDWNTEEISWGFKKHPLIKSDNINFLHSSFERFKKDAQEIILRVHQLEEFNNKEIIREYGLESELDYKVSFEEITLTINPDYKYSGTSDDKSERMQSDSFASLLSYTIGCMMGRYSLDREGLVYAHEGNQGFAELVAEGAYKTFPADNDGILPLMDDAWFDDDVTTRVKEFVRTVWGEEHLQENLEFIAESLCLYAIKPKKGESALDTIRRYLSTQFWKDHLKMYKKRPIYWLFSSGKEKAFECLVYLHRYNDATLARMRTEYVVPLLARYQANIDRLNEQIDTSSGGEATRLKRERDSLNKKFNELRSFDDRLRHYADMRITLDLDDGVKVNYGKFGDLLADVKAITGNAPEII